MLKDLKWDKREQELSDPWSLESFIAWLEQMPPKKKYHFMNCDGACLIGQFMAYNGVEWDSKEYMRVAYGNSHCLGRIAVVRPYTFGEALKRAKKLRDTSA